MNIIQVIDPKEKAMISRLVLEELKDWFEIDEAREQYIEDSKNQIFFAVEEHDQYIGFLCLKDTSKYTMELSVIGVRKQFQKSGVGRQLFHSAQGFTKEHGYEFMQVKTVVIGCYAEYDQTNLFYQSLGFKEFEIFPDLWDPANPCQIYIMSI